MSSARSRARRSGADQALISFGFHIIDVQGRRKGKQPPYEEVRDRVAAELAMHSRARALHQYMRLLAGQALVEGIELPSADSPLVQ